MRYPLIKLPEKTETVLFLISEELKARKFIQSLQKVGFGESDYEPHLDSLIIEYIELDDSDEIFETYTNIMDKQSKKIKEDRESIAIQALKAYHKLLALKCSKRLRK